MEGHKCGTDNCKASLDFYSQIEYFWDHGFYISGQIDCCYSIEDDFCTVENPCGVNQGDCDSNDACLDGLICGLNNCPASLGYDSEFDCCFSGCKSSNFLSIERFC